MEKNNLLIIGGILSFIAALIHVAIIIGGAEWYRFFGAGEAMAQLSEKGSPFPTLITSIIAFVLAIWALYAFSGAGIIRKMPLLKVALCIISAIYLIHGLLGVPFPFLVDDPYFNELKERMTFLVITSLISLVCGLFYLFGLIQIWSNNPNEKLQTSSRLKR